MTLNIKKSKSSNIKALIFIFIAVLILSSCSNGTTDGVVIIPPTEATRFPPLKEVNAELDCVSPRRLFYTDEDIKLTFRLTNFSTKPLVVYEWMRKQENNIKIRFYVHTDGVIPPLSQWKTIEPLLGPPPIARQSLELTLRSSTLIDKSIRLSDFGLRDDKLPEGQLVLIIGELNLQSLRLHSEVVKIQIRRRATVIDE